MANRLLNPASAEDRSGPSSSCLATMTRTPGQKRASPARKGAEAKAVPTSPSNCFQSRYVSNTLCLTLYILPIVSLITIYAHCLHTSPPRQVLESHARKTIRCRGTCRKFPVKSWAPSLANSLEGILSNEQGPKINQAVLKRQSQKVKGATELC